MYWLKWVINYYSTSDILLHLTQFGWKDNSSNSNSETGQRPNILTLYYFLEN